MAQAGAQGTRQPKRPPTSSYVAKKTKPVSTAKAIKTGGVSREKQQVTAKYIIRKQTRKAISQGMSPGSRKGGLGITHNEGGQTLRNAVETLGYTKARRLVKRVVKNQRSR